MYGLINQAVKDLVIENFGEEKWIAICQEAGLKNTKFADLDAYADSLTYDLVGAASKVLKLSAEDILVAFGRNWNKFTDKKGYGELMSMFGHDFFSSIENLNQLHDRMGLAMPNLKPPKFEAKKVSESEYLLKYFSERPGLSPMLFGLLESLAERYKIKIEIKHEPKTDVQKFDLFRIKKVA